MEEKYIYNCSDSNFAAYLQYLGFKSEVKLVENGNKKLKVVFSFEGDNQRQFNNIFNSYRFDEVKLNLNKFIRCKDETFKIVKDTLNNYYTAQKSSCL